VSLHAAALNSLPGFPRPASLWHLILWLIFQKIITTQDQHTEDRYHCQPEINYLISNNLGIDKGCFCDKVNKKQDDF
jgi:hypothetical protein